MDATAWAKQIYKTVKQESCWGSPVHKPTDADLDQFEASKGFKLPMSYREFIKIFGAGEIASHYEIRAPGCATVGRENDENLTEYNASVDLASFNAPITQDILDSYYKSDKDRINRLVYFATSWYRSERIGWDPESLRDDNEREYAIYILIDEDDHASPLCESFTAFIEDVCFGHGYFTRGGRKEDLSNVELPERIFRPQRVYRWDSESATESKYLPGSTWEFRGDFKEFESRLLIWHEEKEAEQLYIFVKATEIGRRQFGLRGLIYQVSAALLDRSVVALSKKKAPKPRWLTPECLPGMVDRTHAPELLHPKTTFSEETLEGLIRTDLESLRSISCAVERGDLRQVKQILLENPEAVHEEREAATPLARAARLGHIRIAEMLLRHGADVNAIDVEGRTSLHWAAQASDQICRLLLKHGANLEIRDLKGYSPLCVAAFAGNDEAADLLIEHGALIDLTILVRLGRFRDARTFLDKNPEAIRNATFPESLILDLIAAVQKDDRRKKPSKDCLQLLGRRRARREPSPPVRGSFQGSFHRQVLVGTRRRSEPNLRKSTVARFSFR